MAGRKISLRKTESSEVDLVVQRHPRRRDPGRTEREMRTRDWKDCRGLGNFPANKIFLPLFGNFLGGENRSVQRCA